MVPQRRHLFPGSQNISVGYTAAARPCSACACSRLPAVLISYRKCMAHNEEEITDVQHNKSK